MLHLSTPSGGRLWEDPTIFGVNKRAPHVPLHNYTSREAALEDVVRVGRQTSGTRQEGSRRSLNGMWDFQLFPRPSDVPDGFWLADYVPEGWTSVTVPGNWETHGHGQPVYTNFKYPFEVRPPYVPDDNPTGCYRNSFSLDVDSWESTFLTLVFEGVDSAFACWLNGRFLGYSQDSRLPAEFDITQHAVMGTNLLAVQVMKWSDGSYLEDQDMWCLSGIFRNVFVLMQPAAAHVCDFCAETPMVINAEGRLEALQLSVQIDVSAQDSEQARNVTVVVSVVGPITLGTDVETSLIASASAKVDDAVWSANDTTGQPDKSASRVGGRARVVMGMDTLGGKVRLWSAEQPETYCLLVELRDVWGSTTCIEACQLGFRQTVLRNGALLHNGRRVMLRGVNRHEHDAVYGKAISEESMLVDLLMMKQANFNAVRNAHYPNCHRFYSLCTAIGLYVVDEANLETHGFDATLMRNELNPANSPLWTGCMFDRVVRMFERHKNEPCIISWSLGNESGYGPVHVAAASYLRARDPSRVVHYEGGGSATPATDLICPMYPRRAQVDKLAAAHPDRPVVLCEYAHSMGNSTGNFDDYWDLFLSNPRCQGGFIWDWVDQALLVTEAHGAMTPFLGYGGDFGDPIHDGQFCCNGLVFPHRQPHPALAEVAHVMAPLAFSSGKIEAASAAHSDEATFSVDVVNLHDFRTLDHVTLQWRLLADGMPVPRAGPGAVVTSDGRIDRTVYAQMHEGFDASTPLLSEDGEHLLLHTHSAAVRRVAEMAWDTLAEGSALACAPGGRARVSCRITPALLQAAHTLVVDAGLAEYMVEVRAVTSADLAWAASGHTLLCRQFNVSDDIPRPREISKEAPSRFVLASRVRQNGNIVVKAWDVDEVARAYEADPGDAEHGGEDRSSGQAPSSPHTPKRVSRDMARAPFEELQQMLQRASAQSVRAVPEATPEPTSYIVVNAGDGSIHRKNLSVELSEDAFLGSLPRVASGSKLECPPSVRATAPLDLVPEEGQEREAAASAPLTAPGGGAQGAAVEQGTDGGEEVPPQWRAEIDASTGMLSSWIVSGQELLEEALQPCFVRAPTDNDVGGSGGTSHAARWLQAGLDRLAIVNADTSVVDSSGTHVVVQAKVVMAAQGESIAAALLTSETGASVEVGGAHWFAEAGAPSAEEAPSDKIDGQLRIHVHYTFSYQGAIAVQCFVDASTFMPLTSQGQANSLPRVGLEVALKADVQECVWHGRGPHENYIDRQTGAPIRLYSSTIQDMHTPYVAPSENGGRCGARWVSLVGSPSDGVPAAAQLGLLVAHMPPRWPPGMAPRVWGTPDSSKDEREARDVVMVPPEAGVHFAVSRFSTGQLLVAKHEHELLPGPVRLHIDGMHMGVGGDDSWTPSVHGRYLIRPGKYAFGIMLKGLSPGSDANDAIQAGQRMRQSWLEYDIGS